MSVIQEKIKTEINQLYAYLSSKKWCDCIVSENSGDLIVSGKTSFEQNPDIFLIFKEFSFASVKRDWQFDFGTVIISQVEDNESKQLNQLYEIEEGNYVFKLYAEDIARPLYILAKNFVVEIVD